MPTTTPPDLTLYDPFARMQFRAQHCFLCGSSTDPATDSVPVFAGWLQDRYGLAERQILLLDQSIRTYQELQIPCCTRCRTQYVEPLEAQMEATVKLGLAGWQALPEKTLFLWLGKMFYGILTTELITELDPLVKPPYPLAENAQMFRRFQAFFQTFQALRVPIEFEDFTPASVFILETAPLEDTIAFEYDDDLTTMVFSIKLDNVVLMACLMDNGIIRQAMRKVYIDAQRPLHPIQVAEFKARVYYAAYLFGVIPEYFVRTRRPSDQHLTYDTLIDDVTGGIFAPWLNSAYAQSLQEMWKRWQIPYTTILRDADEPLSYLYQSDGKPHEMTTYTPDSEQI